MKSINTKFSYRSRLQTLTVIGLMTLINLLASATSQASVTLGDSISSRIEAREQLNAEPYGFDVEWVHWDSGFRATDLRLGDRIVGLDGVRYERAQRETLKSRAIGQHGESSYWEEVGAVDGQLATLVVWRDEEIIEISGQVFVDRFYRNAENQRVMDEGGPPKNIVEKDENGQRIFDTSWSAWYERNTTGQINTWPYILNGGWERSSFNNRKVLKQHLEDQFRIEYLVEHYPSRFATTVEQDWNRIRVYLEGEVVEVTNEDLAYRTRAEELRQEVKSFTDAAITAFEADLGDQLITLTSVAKDDIEGQRADYVGKLVYFDGILQRDIINSLERTYIVAGSDREGYFFLDAESLELAKVFDALIRYKALVHPKLAERYSIYMEVRDEPLMVVYKGSAVMGLMGKIVGMAAGHQDVFIDARSVDTVTPTFAGEIETKVAPVCALQDTDPPEGIVECLVQAVKFGDEDTWRSLFAAWRITPLGNGLPPIYDPDYRVREAIYLRAWDDSRVRILDTVYDAQVNRVSTIKVIHTQGANDPVPTVEEVTVILDHIGLFDGEYRTFVNLTVTRVLRLQSIDAGPWRITDIRHF